MTKRQDSYFIIDEFVCKTISVLGPILIHNKLSRIFFNSEPKKRVGGRTSSVRTKADALSGQKLAQCAMVNKHLLLASISMKREREGTSFPLKAKYFFES